MDIFKILSGRSKPANSSGPGSGSQQSLPSAGRSSNPQLFGRDVDDATADERKKGTKRKRRGSASAASVAVPAELDFFGDSSAMKKDDAEGEAKARKRNKTDNGDGEDSEDESGNEPSAEELLDEEECKRVLRKHKVKITLLADHATAAQDYVKQEEKDKKRKKKDKKKEKKSEAKDSDKGRSLLYPQPLSRFSQLRSRYGISRRLAENIEEQGYRVPTEVQLGGLPLLLGGGDVRKLGGKLDETARGHDIDLLTVAPTGSGKTIAFLIPVLNAILRERKRGGEEEKAKTGPKAIIIAPTKELAGQIVNEGRKLAQGTGMKVAHMRKGMEVVERPDMVASTTEAAEETDEVASEHGSGSESDAGSQKGDTNPKKAAKKKRRATVVKADALVSTPLVLLNALKNSKGDVLPLPSVHYFVLDEADVLLDPLFREQTLALWNACTSPHLRVSLWSATMGASIEELAISTINSRWESLPPSETKATPRPQLVRLVIGLKDTAIPNIAHKLIYAATEQGKLLAVRNLLHPATAATDGPHLRPPFLIFTQTVQRATALHSELLYDIPPEAGGSARIAVLHADLPDHARDRVMRGFRRGEIWVLITTDLLARGVDFRGLNGVVNYDVPTSGAAYVHRVGRTGRAGRDGGVAVTLYTKEDVPYVKIVANVIRASERLKGVKEGEGEIKQWLLDALPTPSKRDKQLLKRRGVEARRTIKGPPADKREAKERARARISTKSGFDRQVENKRKAAVRSHRRDDDDGARKRKVERAAESDFERV